MLIQVMDKLGIYWEDAIWHNRNIDWHMMLTNKQCTYSLKINVLDFVMEETPLFGAQLVFSITKSTNIEMH
jgi:hypothetical protein